MLTSNASGESTPLAVDGVRPRSSETANITLIVGPEQQVFTIREDLICQRCPFFFNAFSGRFLESQTKTITFPDDSPEQVQQLQAWLHDEHVPNPDVNWIGLVKLWLFAEKYHMDDLQNATVDALYAKHAARREGINISFTTLDYVAEHSHFRSPLRRLFADMLTNGISLQQLPNRIENIPHELLQDMCLMLKSYVASNGPSNIALLTNPIATYYSSSAACKATATPRPEDQVNKLPRELFCDNDECNGLREPVSVGESIHICTNHNLKLCHECRHSHPRHRRKKMMSLTSPAYRDAILGPMTVVDAQVNDSGFYCDGPDCDTRLKSLGLPHWALMSGDRYHCLVCNNVDFCSICVRGTLPCKESGHTMLRMRATFFRKTILTEQVSIPERQRRLENGLCMRCAGDGHQADLCTAKEPVLPADVVVEE